VFKQALTKDPIQKPSETKTFFLHAFQNHLPSFRINCGTHGLPLYSHRLAWLTRFVVCSRYVGHWFPCASGPGCVALRCRIEVFVVMRKLKSYLPVLGMLVAPGALLASPETDALVTDMSAGATSGVTAFFAILTIVVAIYVGLFIFRTAKKGLK